ncbi:hypothetical protein NOS3756_23370 [Nostoc sp. NIES-3756]|uniref:DUF2382 domain-containing protein n=1 Tax=Nostoc sp. NIES-3756 TaxID=1751286 RepID=UPI00072234D4|nr:DUF2382 domain-containing protein [Nostoc sp. NIES-3756]BAT53377.1 hypothetical protein NOS3756_23370 [Nostoc sp. NIES-3756]BAY38887.1 hypothetical protein NIES2111_32360 [Nostoc sp. NIES-2111]
MPLYKLEEFDPNYRETFGGDDVKALELYTQSGVRVGGISDVLVDNEGRFRYLVIDTNLEDSISKKILLPIGLSHIDYPARRVYVDGLSKEQVAHLPEYHDNIAVDADYEERVRGVFRPQTSNLTYDRQTYNYQQEPALYDLNDQYHQTFKLYEERLIANKQRVKTGEVAVGKHIETETARVEVPIQRERVVIERSSPTSTDAVVDSSEVHFQQGEVARIELYEETPEIRKEAFVREEVRVRKIIENDTVEAQEVIRREELDIDTEGNLLVNETNLEKHGNV